MAAATSLHELAMTEVTGKNAAIASYDQMIWTVRSGFLTLFFGGWGLLLKALLEVVPLQPQHYAIVGALLLISTALAFAGASIDRNYVRRKFRVIASLNQLLHELAGGAASLSHGAGTILIDQLRVSGDTDDESYKIPGYANECRVGRIIYAVPLSALAVGLLIIAIAQRLMP